MSAGSRSVDDRATSEEDVTALEGLSSPTEGSLPPRAAHREGESSGGGFFASARLVSLLTLLSRISGLVRDAVLAAVLGMAAVADAFFLAFLVPNLFRRLFGEGALSAAFIPKYSKLLEEDPARAARLASLCFWLLAAFLLVVTVIGEGLLFGFSRLGDWDEQTLWAVKLAMIMLPYMPLICLVALVGGMLQVHGRFGSTGSAPVILNVVMIAGAAWGSMQTVGEPDMRTVVPIAISVLAAGMLQLAWQVVSVLGVERLRFSFAGVGQEFRAMLIMMVPMVLGLAVFQINAFFDGLLAFALSPKGDRDTIELFGYVVACPVREGSVAALQWAQRLYQFPLGVFGIAIATAVFPALARAAFGGGSEGLGRGDAAESGNTKGGMIMRAPEGFAVILRQGLRLTVFIGFPASVGLMVVSLPLCRAVYERGRFGLEDAMHVASILVGYAAAIWAYSMMHVLTRAFYALHDSRTPLRISLICVGFNLCCNLVLIWPLGAAGLAWSTAITAVLQVVLLLRAIGGRVDRVATADVWRSWGSTVGMSLVMGMLILPWTLVFPPEALGRGESALLLAGMVLVGGAAFIGMARAMGRPEPAWMLERRSRRGQVVD